MFFKKYKNLIFILLIFIMPLIIVNLFSYSSLSIIYIPILNRAIYKTGLETYVSIITVLSLLFAVYQWQSNNKNQRLADINCLLEELRHNVNILGELFLECDFKNLYKEISKEIDRMNDFKIYPNPTDNDSKQYKYDKYIKYKNYNVEDIVPIRCQFINTLLSSRQFYSITSKRIFLNLGHLKYSIDRHNTYVKQFNELLSKSNRIPIFKTIQEEYYKWLHFRLHYLLIDLLKNINKGDVLDKDYFNEMMDKIK